MHQKGEGAGIAHQHALAAPQERERVRADAVPQAHGLHPRDARGRELLPALGELALGHDGLELAHGRDRNHDAAHAAFQNARRQPGGFQIRRFGQNGIALGQQILHRDDLPA